MDKKLFDSIIDKIAVTEPVNDPQAYQFTCQVGELFVPFKIGRASCRERV